MSRRARRCSAYTSYEEGQDYRFEHNTVEHTITTGDWTVGAERETERVLVVDHRSGKQAKLYLGHMQKRVQVRSDHRFKFYLTGVQYVGTTDLAWQSFVGKGRNPVRYFHR